MHAEKLCILIVKFQTRLDNIICYKVHYELTAGNIEFKIDSYNGKGILL